MNAFFKNITLLAPVLRVHSLSKVRRFYSDVLGFKEISATENRVEFSASGKKPALLILEEDAQAPEPPRGSAGLFHLAFLYPDRASLALILRRLLNTHYPLQGSADHGVSEAIYLADPEGNGLELYADREPDLWPRRGMALAMFTEALDFENLLATSAESALNYTMPAGTRLGHIHLCVSKVDAAELFYGEKLGFKVQQKMPSALFMGRDGYHHHLGANVWQSNRPAVPGSRGLVKFKIAFSLAEEFEECVKNFADKVSSQDVLKHASVLLDFDGIGVELEKADV